MNFVVERKNILLKCIRCKHSKRYHPKDKNGNTYCESVVVPNSSNNKVKILNYCLKLLSNVVCLEAPGE